MTEQHIVPDFVPDTMVLWTDPKTKGSYGVIVDRTKSGKWTGHVQKRGNTYYHLVLWLHPDGTPGNRRWSTQLKVQEKQND